MMKRKPAGHKTRGFYVTKNHESIDKIREWSYNKKELLKGKENLL